MKKNPLILPILLITLFSCNSSEPEKPEIPGTMEKSSAQVLASIRDSIAKYPDEPRLKYNLAIVLQDAGRIPEALAALDSMEVEAPDPSDPYVYYNYLFKKSELQELAGDTSGAIHSLEQLIQPGELTQAGINLANLYAATKNPRTIRLCDLMIQMDSLHRAPEPRYFKGVYYDNTGNEKKAIEAFDECIKTDYNFIDAYLEKGRILYKQKKYQEALAVYELALKVSNSFPDTYFWIARCQEAMGDKVGAKLNYQRAYGLDKTLTEAKEAADRL